MRDSRQDAAGVAGDTRCGDPGDQEKSEGVDAQVAQESVELAEDAFFSARRRVDRTGVQWRIPQPKTMAIDLRAVWAQVAPSRVVAFDAERTAAVEAVGSQDDVAPMRRFLRQWALTVAIERVIRHRGGRHPRTRGGRGQDRRADPRMTEDAGRGRR
jgi:hypothetical protein